MTAAALFIVEDEMIVAKDIRETVKSLGYRVAGMAKTGEAALQKIEETRPDLVLMDIRLAGELDGIETAGRIHSLYDIPVIYLTAYADNDLLERAKITEPYGYILKPYDERELHSIIEMALYKHAAEREIKKRDAILFAVSSTVEWLLRVSHAKPGRGEEHYEFNQSEIRDIFEQIGLAVALDAIGIFQIQAAPGKEESISLKYEWTGEGTAPGLYKPELKKFTFESLGLMRWKDQIAAGKEIIAGETETHSPEARFFSLLGVRSGVILPVYARDALWGFTGFFTRSERPWSASEIEALRITANLIGTAMA
ncbi:MAG: two-component response regulator [Methanoregula sp. PtaU1.Bin051]|nr:MAG: two-component response regulator [Methanoregula sp. PtaU1.Bin051]